MLIKQEIKNILKEKYSNIYLEKYFSLLESRARIKHEKFITQQHHIIPRYDFKLDLTLDNSLKDCDNNLVYLSGIDHVLAHIYLYKAAITDIARFYNAGAVHKLLYNTSTIISENYILDNYDDIQKDLIEIKKNMSYLIKVNHHDASRGNNSRAQVVRNYNEEGKLINIFSCVRDANDKLNRGWSPSYIGNLLIKYPIIIVDNYILTKLDYFDFDAYRSCLDNKLWYESNGLLYNILVPGLEIRDKVHKRRKISQYLVCDNCGKEFNRQLYFGDNKYSSGKVMILCNYCCNIGNRLRGKAKQEAQKEKMSLAAKGRHWIHNMLLKDEKQVHDCDIQTFLDAGWELGQLPRYRIRKDDSIKKISLKYLDTYLRDNWELEVN